MRRYEQLKNLMVMAAADGRLSEGEIAFLAERSDRWGLTEEEFAAAVRHAISHDAQLTLPPRLEDRLELLRDLVRTMAADGQLAEMEKQLFALAAARMQITDQQLASVLNSVLNEHGSAPTNENAD